MDYWGGGGGGGGKGYVGPPSQIIGGAWPPWPPLFLRLCVFASKFCSDDEILHAAKSCHASYDFRLYRATYIACHMCHAICVVMWAHLKNVEMGKLDSWMSIYISYIIHRYRREEIKC